MNPEVSVIIPAYNSEEYIAQALSSVLNQSYHNLEVILVDDASTDSTIKIARSFSDPRLRIIKNSKNRGVSYGRNRGIRQAKGKWIALLDSDDWYAPLRIESLLQVAESHHADLVADDLFLIKEDEQQHWSTLLSESSQSEISSVSLIDAVKFVTSDRLSPINGKRTWSLGYTKPLIKREFLINNHIFYNEKINVGEDFILYLECLRQDAKFCLLAQPYYYYRTRESSLSTRKPTEYLSQSCEITQSFIDKEVRSQAESKLLQALLQNLTIFQKRLQYYRLLEKIKDGKLLEMIEIVIDSPYVLTDLFKKLIVWLKNKPKTIFTRQEIIYQAPLTSKKPVYANSQELFQPYTK